MLPWMSIRSCHDLASNLQVQRRTVLPYEFESELFDEPSNALDNATEPQPKKAVDGGPTKHPFFLLITDARLVVFLFGMLLMGMAFTMLTGYLFLFLLQDLHAKPALLGATAPFAVSMELPLFFFGKPLLHRVGPGRLVAAGQITLIIRALLYLMLTEDTVTAVVFIELLHGVAFGFMWLGAVQAVSQRAPQGAEATALSLLGAAYNGLGTGAGNLIGGRIFADSGAPVLFITSACISTVGLVICASSVYFDAYRLNLNWFRLPMARPASWLPFQRSKYLPI